MSRRTRVRGRRRRGIKSRRIAGSPKKTNTGLNTDLSAMITAISDVAADLKDKSVRKSHKLRQQLKQTGTRSSNRRSLVLKGIEKTKQIQKELEKLEKNIAAFEGASQGQIKAKKGKKGKNTFETAELNYVLDQINK